jgi:thiol:disulfide interchange protein DsbD
MKNFLKIFSVLYLLTLSNFVLGNEYQNYSHSKARLISTYEVISNNSEVFLAFDVKPIKGWHTYWKNSGDSGSPTILKWTINQESKDLKINWPYPERIETSGIVTFGYKDRNLLIIPLTDNFSSDLKINLDAEWLVCDDVCIPQYGQFSLNLKFDQQEEFSSHKNSIDDFFKKVPNPYPNDFLKLKIDTSQIKLKEINQSSFKFLDFYPSNNDLVTNQKPIITEDQKELKLIRSDLSTSNRLQGVIKTYHENQIKYFKIDLHETKEPQSLLLIVGFAFLGGFILNFMPCVFPILFLKLKYFLTENNSKKLIKQNLAYVMGVIFSMLALSLIIFILKASGNFVGWGFQLQSPLFITLISYVFLILSFYSLGWFDLEIPIHQKVQNKITGNKLINHFLTGILAVIIASPCTAPFMGAAIGFALTQNLLIIFLTFLSLGLGFSLPFLLVCIFPKLIQILPKPGKWMDIFKKLMTIPFILTIIWLLWILYYQVNTIFIIIIISLFSLISLFLYFIQKNPHKKLSKRSLIIPSLLTLIIALIPSQNLLPQNNTYFSSSKMNWMDFHKIDLDQIIKDNQNVFIDFTAKWCLTCQVNDKVVFSNDDIVDFVKNKNIQMIKADWTNKDEKIAKVLANYNRAGVPFYILFYNYGQDYIILPEILTPDLFREKINQKIP